MEEEEGDGEESEEGGERCRSVWVASGKVRHGGEKERAMEEN